MQNIETMPVATIPRAMTGVRAAADAPGDFGRLAEIWQRCLVLVAASRSEPDALMAIAAILSETCPTILVAIATRTETAGQQFQFNVYQVPADGLRSELRDRFCHCCHSACTTTNPICIDQTPGQGAVLAIRIGETAGGNRAIVAYVSGPGPVTLPTVTIFQYAAASLSLYQRLSELALNRQHLETLAAAIDLTGRLTVCQSFKEASEKLVEDLRQHVDCHHAYLAVRRSEFVPFQLVAASGIELRSLHPELVELIESTGEEAALRNRLSTWPPQPQDQAGLCVHQQLFKQLKVAQIVSVPLVDSSSVVRGVWVLAFADRAGTAEGRTFLRVAASPVAAAIAVLQRAERHWLVRQFAAVFNCQWLTRWRLVTGIVAVTAALLCWPVQHIVTCECELQAVKRRTVAAPFDGKLEVAIVRPGDLVTVGELLARLDGRELRMEQAGLEADLMRVAKKRDGEMAEKNHGEASVLSFELDRIDAKLQLIESKYDHLEIRSPIEGLVLTGDLRREEGMPLERGQKLFEIAPLDSMIVEVSIPESDLRYVSADVPADIVLESDIGSTLTTSLQRIHPRGEIRNQSHVFIGECSLANESRSLRPGMHGQARLKAGRCLLGWRLFHRFWEQLRLTVGW